MIGGSFIKSIISASVAKGDNGSDPRPWLFYFYMMVNVGAFYG